MRIGVMCSGNGTNFENIVRTCREHEVVLMVHNKKECGAKKRAIKLGIPHVHIKSADEEEIIRLFQVWRVDLIVLAGWMRIVSPKLIDAFPNKIINIHPSILPKYKGLNAIGQALESGDTITGCTVHYVTEELDSGKIIEQSVVSIFSDDTVETLTRRVQQEEHRLLPMVIDNLIKEKLNE
mgnify:CR=1 FL=1|tara:strand:+ start:406 stop:948 length:543 start_codon:yes stop_codon:yes gene_type:complete